MRITIFGTGYVGLVTGTCFAAVGNDVLCVDIDKEKIDNLKNGIIPIYEPGLEGMIKANESSGRLKFSTDIEKGVHHGIFQMIAVGTPPDEDGSADLQHVIAVSNSIATHMNEYRVIINKSTVPVGTADKVTETIKDTLAKRGVNYEFDVVSNPEFLKEGGAIDDFMKPDRIIVGSNNPETTQLLHSLYAPFNRNHDRLIPMDVRSAELTKYAANAILATKITFMNELANLAEYLGADIENVRIGIGADPRIGYHFIYPGCGYGGSCFPKDVRALAHTSGQAGYDAKLLKAVEAVNDHQKTVLFNKIYTHFNNDIKGKVFSLWGLSFKPGTDDMRDAPSLTLIDALLKNGAIVQAFDPVAMDEAKKILGQQDNLKYCDSPIDSLNNSDALVINTEWKVFRSPDFDEIKRQLSNPVIFDGRNIYDPVQMKEIGIQYYGIGRGLSIE